MKSSWLWEFEPNEETETIIFSFRIEYSKIEENAIYHSYECHFTVDHIRTLFIVKCNLEAGKEADFCRMGSICHLNLRISRCEKSPVTAAVMYEIIAEQAMWAVCGRTSGKQ